MGTPDFAAVILRRLLGWPGAEVLCVYTQPDRPSGRGREPKPSPVKLTALESNVEVRQPLNFKDQADVAALRALEPDVLVVAAYGLILPQSVLDACRLMPINVHASLLPRWRGAAPIQRAIEAGDAATGVTIMRMVLGLDAGPMLLQRALRIADTDHAGTLHDELAELGADALLDALTRLPQGRLLNMAQDEQRVTYAPKLTKDQGRIDWTREAASLHNHIRAMHPWPGAYFDWTAPCGKTGGKVLTLTIEPGRIGEDIPAGTAPGTILGVVVTEQGSMLAIACADKAYLTPRVTPQGKKPQDATAFACGYLKTICQG
ncbi:MAG: methionyl-tRNA formyltransferase [Desulfovibrionales bacterium GWA2_65_9]|nr:MAG: methionyl-tRNA formyltransferase [Desulfovibrionales bacterium GWA2_65_9]